MFEDQKPIHTEPPANLPSEPADIFESVDKPAGISTESSVSTPNALKSGLLKPKSTATILPNPDYSPPAQSETIVVQTRKPKVSGNMSGLIKIIVWIIGFFAFLVLAYGGWFLYQKLQTIDLVKKNNPQAPIVTTNNNSNPIATSTGSAPQAPEVLFGDTDSDKDGLTDAEEKMLGTDSKKTDTDGDSLSDSDEVKIWLTDPLKLDTDADTYSDGSEILNGFNPRGAGRFSPPMPIVRFVTTTATGSAPFYINNVIKTEVK